MTLERLWAGWRSGYVAGVPSVPAPHGTSIFRRILESGLPDAETFIVHRGREAFAILNAYPYGTGHLLVMPYREIGELDALNEAETIDLWATVRDAVIALKTTYQPDGVNVGLNLGRAGGAGIPSHLHVHVLPRWNGDTNFMTTIAETRVLPESLSETWAKLRTSWPAQRSPNA